VEGLNTSFIMPINTSNELREANKERKTLLSLPFPVRNSHSATVEGGPQEKDMNHIAKDAQCHAHHGGMLRSPRSAMLLVAFFALTATAVTPVAPVDVPVVCRRNRAALRPYLGGKGVTQKRRCRALSSVASSGNVGVAPSDQRPAAWKEASRCVACALRPAATD